MLVEVQAVADCGGGSSALGTAREDARHTTSLPCDLRRTAEAERHRVPRSLLFVVAPSSLRPPRRPPAGGARPLDRGRSVVSLFIITLLNPYFILYY